MSIFSSLKNLFTKGVYAPNVNPNAFGYGTPAYGRTYAAEPTPQIKGATDTNFANQVSASDLNQAQMRAFDLANQQKKTGNQPTGNQPTGNQPTGDTGYYVQQPSQESYDWEGAARSGYEQLMGGLNAIEEAYRAEYPVTQQEIATGYEQSKAPLNEAATTQKQELATRATTEQQNAQGNIAKSRQLYNELKQQRMAELSAGGLSSSSVAEAQMERLGRATYGDIAQTRQTLQGTLSQIAQESSKVIDFYNRKLTELETNKNMAIEQARVKFNSGLAQIAQTKGQAGSQYQQQVAQQRYEAMQNLRQESLQIQQFNAQMKMDLDKWAVQKQTALADAQKKAYTMPDWSQFQQTYGEAAKQYGLVPNISVSKAGPTYSYSQAKTGSTGQLTDEELLQMQNSGLVGQ